MAYDVRPFCRTALPPDVNSDAARYRLFTTRRLLHAPGGCSHCYHTWDFGPHNYELYSLIYQNAQLALYIASSTFRQVRGQILGAVACYGMIFLVRCAT